jgi:hypothetical protein
VSQRPKLWAWNEALIYPVDVFWGGDAMNEEEFRSSIYAKYREYFDHVYRLHAFAEDAIAAYNGRTANAYQATLVLILPRAYKSFDSVRRLCEVASCEDAAVVLRSLLNLVVVTRWITLKPDTRAKKYLHWYWIEMHRDAEQSPPNAFPKEWIAKIANGYGRVKSQFEYKDKNGRTKIAKRWYEPEVNTLLDMFKEVDLEKHYERAYKPLSGVEHSDAMAYLAMLSHAERHEDGLKLAIQSDLYVPHYLRNAFQWFADIFRTCNRTLGFADSAKLEEIVNLGMQFHKADMQARGIPTT